MYGTYFFNLLFYDKNNRLNCSSIPYSILDNNISNLINNNDVSFGVDVCFFNVSNNKNYTFNDYKTLKCCKITKKKRDYVFKILCDICYRLNIDPYIIIKKLDVDFVRYYKKPTELII